MVGVLERREPQREVHRAVQVVACPTPLIEPIADADGMRQRAHYVVICVHPGACLAAADRAGTAVAVRSVAPYVGQHGRRGGGAAAVGNAVVRLRRLRVERADVYVVVRIRCAQEDGALWRHAPKVRAAAVGAVAIKRTDEVDG